VSLLLSPPLPPPRSQTVKWSSQRRIAVCARGSKSPAFKSQTWCSWGGSFCFVVQPQLKMLTSIICLLNLLHLKMSVVFSDIYCVIRILCYNEVVCQIAANSYALGLVLVLRELVKAD